jgi:hypothetical protein
MSNIYESLTYPAQKIFWVEKGKGSLKNKNFGDFADLAPLVIGL